MQQASRLWITGLFQLCVVQLFLVSCSGCSDDPTQAGFFCGVRNITTGTYERRQTTLTNEAIETEGVAQSQQAQLANLQQQETNLNAERTRL
jgi:hypothetical protein